MSQDVTAKNLALILKRDFAAGLLGDVTAKTLGIFAIDLNIICIMKCPSVFRGQGWNVMA